MIRVIPYIANTLLVCTLIACDSNTNATATTDATAHAESNEMSWVQIGEQRFTFTPDRQCLIHETGIASIWGHMIETPTTSVAIDLGDPTSISVEDGDGLHTYRSTPGSIEANFQNHRVTGTVTFQQGNNAGAGTQAGSFQVQC